MQLQENISIEQKIGQLIIMGFHGTSLEDLRVKKTIQQVQDGEIGGIAVYRHNIENNVQLASLMKAFKDLETPYPPFISLDQEGGRVQRLNSSNGFHDTCSAKEVARTMTEDNALEHYRDLGDMLKNTGFNFNCAPCVDLDDTPGCKVVGGLERAYSSDVSTVVSYASTMIDGLKDKGILNCIKHFPGHGRVNGDTHEGLVDVTSTWSEIELEPFRLLIKEGKVDAVMSAHLINNNVDSKLPCTLSVKWLQKLRDDLGFNGVVVSDCMHMGAMLKHYTLEETLIFGINAGIDIFYYSNNPLAAKEAGVRHSSDSKGDYVEVNDWIVPDPDLPNKIREVILAALKDGRISKDKIDQSFKRIIKLKSKLLYLLIAGYAASK